MRARCCCHPQPYTYVEIALGRRTLPNMNLRARATDVWERSSQASVHAAVVSQPLVRWATTLVPYLLMSWAPSVHFSQPFLPLYCEFCWPRPPHAPVPTSLGSSAGMGSEHRGTRCSELLTPLASASTSCSPCPFALKGRSLPSLSLTIHVPPCLSSLIPFANDATRRRFDDRLRAHEHPLATTSGSRCPIHRGRGISTSPASLKDCVLSLQGTGD